MLLYIAIAVIQESESVGFESLKYKSLESSDVQVCLNVTGTVHWNFSVLINTRVAMGTAGKFTIGLLYVPYV